MGREATKAVGNVWYEARKNASLHDRTLSSREGAAERLNMSVSAVADAELGITKCMPVDKAVLMAELYRAPQLLNHYCLHECPIGHRLPISDVVTDLPTVTVKILHCTKVRDIQDVRTRLVDVAAYSCCSDFRTGELVQVLDYLTELARATSELRTITEMLMI